MAGMSCAISGASCCVLPTYFEATRFLSGYCGALCFIFCQVIIKEGPDIYSSFSSSTECLNLSNHITFVTESIACLGISGSGGGIQDRATFNHQHFRLVNESKNRFSHSFYFQRSVFVTSQSRLSHGEKVVNAYFCHSFRQRN